jgi:FG-GAP-like repeat/FG-GAP repeat
VSAPDASLDAVSDVTRDAVTEASVVEHDAPDDAADAPANDALDVGGDASFDAATDEGNDVFDAPAMLDARDVPIFVDVPVAPDVVDAPSVRDVVDVLDVPVVPRCTVAPRPLSPLAGTRLGTGVVTLTWRNAVAASSIEVQVSIDPSFATLERASTGGGGDLGDGRVLFGALARGTHFWRVRGLCGGASEVSPWSAPWSFWVSGAGTSTSPIGWVRDLNGDGRADFVVGTPRNPSTFVGGRAVDVYFGGAGAAPFSGAPSLSVPGTLEGFGAVVAIVPDMNGDGRAELAVGACPRNGGALCASVVDVYSFVPSTRTFTRSATFAMGTAEQRFGADLAGLGDVDGDGYGDLLIAAPGTFSSVPGLVFAVRGSAAFPSALESVELRSVAPPMPTPTVYGWSLAGVGDVTGDGLADALVTSFERAFVFPGRVGGATLFATPISLPLTATEEGTWGFVAAAAGDVNLDGVADFALGRPGASRGLGDVSVFYGGASATTGRAADYTVTGARDGGRFGQALAGGGNVAGALDEDLVVGAPGANGGTGEAYLLTDRRPVGAATLTAVSTVDSLVGFGRSASVIGDLDGDGLDELAIGVGPPSPRQPTGPSAVFTWRGSATVVPVSTGTNTVNGTSDYGLSLGER